MFKYIAPLAMALSSTPAMARDVAVDDGNDLLQVCSQSGIYMEGYCLGYIRGVSLGADWTLLMKDKRICYSDNITMSQLRDVIVAYIRRNPNTRNENVLLLVIKASLEAWPCDGI